MIKKMKALKSKNNFLINHNHNTLVFFLDLCKLNNQLIMKNKIPYRKIAN